MKKPYLFAGLLSLFAAAPAFGEVLYDPVLTVGPSRMGLGLSFTKSKVGMETRNTSFDIERTFFGGAFHYGITSDLQVIGQIGLSNKVQYENSDSGDGYLFGGGAVAEVYRNGLTRILVHGVFNYINEDVGDNDGDATITELHTGVVASHAVKNNFNAYAGMDLVPYSDGDIKFKGSSSASMERDDLFNLRLGAEFSPTPQTAVNFSIAFISETTINAGFIFKF